MNDSRTRLSGTLRGDIVNMNIDELGRDIVCKCNARHYHRQYFQLMNLSPYYLHIILCGLVGESFDAPPMLVDQKQRPALQLAQSQRHLLKIHL